MSFYQFPFFNMLKAWYKKLPADFQMAMKANRNITHRKKFKKTFELVNKFYKRAAVLKDKLGCILFQTPPSFQFNDDNFALLDNFLKSLDKNYRNVFEFRHNSWWIKEVYTLLEKYQCGFCTVSGLNMPDTVQITSDFTYFRLHGPQQAYASKYSSDEIEYWADKIRAVSENENVKNIYCYFNNDRDGFAVENAQELQNLLAK